MTARAFMSIAEAGCALRDGTTTSVALTELMLRRIDRYDKTLNAYMTVTSALAREQAARADRELADGRNRGPLHGIPIAIKDLCATKGIRTTAGSKLYEHWVPDYDATVVRRLRDAGAVMLGKTGMHELAYGTTSDNAFFGAVRNPWQTDYIAGGSSGGSAAAVAAGLAYGAVGTDTGCSIRQPAHCCGIVGHKPTFGLVSKAGVVPLVWSMDHVGPMTRTVEDAAIMLGAMAGADRDDPYALDTPCDQVFETQGGSVEGLRLGIVRRFFYDGYDDVVGVVDSAVAKLVAQGARRVELDIPEIDEASAHGRMMFLEALALHEKDLRERPEYFGDEVRGKLEACKNISATDYARAKHYRGVFVRRMERLLEDCDVLVVPTATVSAVPIANPPADYARNAWKNTCVFDYTGQPSVSIPCGATPAGLPVGMMLTGRLLGDGELLRSARVIEAALGGFAVPPDFPD